MPRLPSVLRHRDLARWWLATGLVVLLWLVPAGASAQLWVNPYYGKNKVRYDRFDWLVYSTDHFDILFYPEIEPHLERVASYAESAYQQVSSDLKHDLAFKVPLVLYKTHSEFEQTNLFPGFLPEGVAAFTEPVRDRIVLPIDEPPDLLQGLITHELTHVFEFDIIPRSILHHALPLWVDEGLADYERGVWEPLDLMMVRDAAISGQIPTLSDLDEFSNLSSPRLGYNLGHAVFEFIEGRWGKDGIRGFLLELRRSAIGGDMAADVYDETFGVPADDFERDFAAYLKQRFHPFRDELRPANYGRNLVSREAQRSHLLQAYAVAPSPSGELAAIVTGNHKDRELDIVLISVQDGRIVRNLTNGFDQSRGFEYIAVSSRFAQVPWIAWAPTGDLVAYLARTGKHRSLILEDPLTATIRRRIALTDVDEPESPAFSPDSRMLVLSALQHGVRDIYRLELHTGTLANLTNDAVADYAPVIAPDGAAVVYAARISGFEKLFELDLKTGRKTQLTFGTHQDTAPAFAPDGRTVYFASTATDPNAVADPGTAANGDIFNIWSLDLITGALRQHTDVATGALVPVVARRTDGQPLVLFIGYEKGEWGLYSTKPEERIREMTTTDYGTPAPHVDFQPAVLHTFGPEHKRRKKMFEKVSFEGTPPVNVGVTSNGTILGGTQIGFSDILGDQQFGFVAASVSNYRTVAGTWINLAGRFQYAIQGFSYSWFFYANPYGLYDPGYGYASFYDPANAIAVRSIRGATVWGIYPFDRYRRLELGGGMYWYNDRFLDPEVDALGDSLQQRYGGRRRLNRGSLYSLSAALVQETTIFREWGPLAGSTFRLRYEAAPRIAGSLSRQTIDVDARRYLRLSAASLVALRVRAFRSSGTAPDYFYFGGYGDLRGYQYLEFAGNRGFLADAEWRFPVIDLALTPIGLVGPIRGTLFANVGGAEWNGRPFKPLSWDGGRPRLVDARGSYGFGLSLFVGGFPVHLDWTRRTLFDDERSDRLFGRDWRRPRFNVWVGLDF